MERGKEGRKETREGGRKELCRKDGRTYIVKLQESIFDA